MTRPSAFFATLVAWLLLGAGQAMAFESDEHREMSNIAIEVAKIYVATMRDPRIPAEGVDALRKWSGKYGHITECVDFFLYPEKMLSHAWRVNSSSATNSAKGDTTVEKVPVSSGGIPDAENTDSAELDGACKKQGALFAQASHSNHAHFQQDLLMSIRVWHLLAVSIGQRERNYYGGLFINAISDHYLQDYFAPGHIVTVRDRLTDVPATATHDLANQMGAIFRPKLLPKVRRILNFICSDYADDKACVVRPELDRILTNPNQKLQINDVAESAHRLKDGNLVLFRGDGLLNGSQQAAQRLLLLCVQVASVLDVLDGENSLQRFKFEYVLDRAVPTASTDFGEYQFAYQGDSIKEVLASTPTEDIQAQAARATSGVQNTRLTVCSFGGCDDTLYKLRTRSPILSISTQRESQSKGSFPARNLYTVEASTTGMLVPFGGLTGRWLTGVELIPTFGYATYRQGTFQGQGPTLRVSAAIPETEFAIGLYTRWLSYPEASGTARRLSYGLRIESGFSNYLTFFLTGGIDYGPNTNGVLARGRMWAGGLRLGAPLTRITSAFQE